MTVADAILIVTFVGLTAYALFGGADFGAGFWDLVARAGERGTAQRRLIEDTIGPVWEANHVWLIFALVVVWTGFPAVFAAVASTLYIPLTLAAFGIILRGSTFAFQKALHEAPLGRTFARIFGLSSILTPFFLGAVAGGVASGRVPPGNASGDVMTAWLNPTSTLAGALATGICAYLAAVYLTADARRSGDLALADGFRRRALLSGVVVGAIALVGIGVLAADAPYLASGLFGRGLPLLAASTVGGVGSLVLLVARRYRSARVTAALAVAGVLWGWAVAQYPFLLVGHLTVADAAAGPATLSALLVTLLVGAVLVLPSLAWLYLLFQRGVGQAATGRRS
ncbi:MAG TPA: cytochrome d ubiquinol oxidase subunit II [Candidatus Limnocylindria bacterium]|nr:cytochrome d ubiquinol oxidase subunit II [Candidatus Limnocylindria bacterium]